MRMQLNDNPVFIKTKRVIESCETADQLKSAKRYLDLFGIQYLNMRLSQSLLKLHYLNKVNELYFKKTAPRSKTIPSRAKSIDAGIDRTR